MSESATFVLPTSGPDALPPLPDALPPMPETGSTALDRIKAKLAAEREEAAKSLTFKLPVPRRPTIVVEFAAVEQTVWGGLLENQAKTNMKPVDTNARLLLSYCRGVYLEDDEGVLHPASTSLQPPAPTFGGDLAALGTLLEIPYGGVRHEWVKALYMTDGDLISTAAAVLDMSGFARGQEIEASAKGN